MRNTCYAHTHTHTHTYIYKVYQLEEISPADEAKGVEARFLDMSELKEGRQV